MKKIPLFACCLLAFLTATNAQTGSFGTLPLASKPDADPTLGPEIKDTPQYKKALEIYQNLVRARGDNRLPVPTFTMRKQRSNLAFMDYQRMEITLEEDAYNVCQTFGKNADAAVAFLLGHELTHWYEKHAWRRDFISGFADLEVKSKLGSIDDKIANETEADCLGGFLAYSAGYGLFDKGADLIQKLYTEYGMKENVDGYPSLTDRKNLSLRTAEKMEALVDAYEMANMLLAVGLCGEALEYYRYILMRYQSREIYNNVGVTAFLLAMNEFRPEDPRVKYRYPIQLDLESSGAKGSGAGSMRDSMLRQAIQHFEAAISMDPNYTPAYLNKACAYALLGETDAEKALYTERAGYIATNEVREMAQKSGNPKMIRDADILIGILEARKGDKASIAEAQKLFSAHAGESALAAINMEILQTGTAQKREREEDIFADPETIGGKDMLKIANPDGGLKPLPKKNMFVTIDQRLIFTQIPAPGADSKVFVSVNKNENRKTFFHITRPDYKGKTSKGLAKGTSREAIVKAHDLPLRSIQTPRGEIMVYGEILFILDAAQKLERWVNYK